MRQSALDLRCQLERRRPEVLHSELPTVLQLHLDREPRMKTVRYLLLLVVLPCDFRAM